MNSKYVLTYCFPCFITGIVFLSCFVGINDIITIRDVCKYSCLPKKETNELEK